MTAKVLFLDLETSPIVAHIWSLRDLNVGLNQIIADPEIIGVGYSWDGKPAKYVSTWDEGGREAMLGFGHSLLDEADVVVGWNSQGFDVKWLQGEFVKVGLEPPSPFKNLDLYKVARSRFRWPSYKLQHAAEVLLGDSKLATGGHQLWVDCINGDEKARARMARYARQDVDLLPKLLDKLRPWIGNQVNFSLYEDGKGCPKCGSHNGQKRGQAMTAAGIYQRYQCMDCAGWYRDTRREGGATKTGVA